MKHLVIIGNGLAAHRLVARLVRQHYAGTITVLESEPEPAYNRVLLTSVVDSTLPADFVHLPETPPGVVVRHPVTVTGIDRLAGLVHTRSGESFPYDTLVLATGARPRIPEVPGLVGDDGVLADGVSTLRTLSDCEGIRDRLDGTAVVLGGGVLGTEVASALAGNGIKVTLVHSAAWPMNRQLDQQAGTLLSNALLDADIDLRLLARASHYRPGKLTLDGGEVLSADPLIVCSGVRAEVTLARQAGLAVRDGVVVDDQLRTSDVDIHAIGDCAEYAGLTTAGTAAAWEQADTLANELCAAGPDVRYRGCAATVRLRARELDVVSIGAVRALQRRGDGVDVVTLSDPARGRYAALSFDGGRVTAAVMIGLPQASATIRNLHHAGQPVPADRLALLLGTAPVTRSGSGRLPDDAVICRCNTVTKKALINAFDDGSHDVAALAEATRATTGCGSCTDDVRRLCTSLNRDQLTTPPQQDTDSRTGNRWEIRCAGQ